MIEDFKAAIGAAWLIKQKCMELDKAKIWPYHLPEVGASEDELAGVECRLGHRIDPRYREFLKCANGWPAFYQAVDLFGTRDLIEGPRKENAEFVMSFLDDHVLHSSGFVRGDLLPIAATTTDRDIFLIGRPHARSSGTVVWYAGEEIDRFENFDEFFLAMIEYNKQELADFRKQSQK